jgi:hypothetical protein
VSELSDNDERTRIAVRRSAISLGTELNQTYRIDSLIGVGGMGEVFKGHNIQTGDPVAIKVVLPEYAQDEMILELFRKEARILNHLSHDAIVRYYVFSIDPTIGRPYLAMEFVDGPSLAERAKTSPLSADDCAHLLKRLADGLQKAHEAGVIHRDMSPDNVILPGGLVQNAKIIDFGIARSANVGGATLLGGSFAGKYSYVSPEQLGLFGGEVTAKSDIYSLALVMAAGLRGRPIDMSGSQLEVIEKRRAVPDLSDIPTALRGVLSAMLQPDPEARPASMAEVRDWFDKARDSKPTPQKDKPAGKPVARSPAPQRPSPGPMPTPAAPGTPSNALRNTVFIVGVLAVIGVGALGGWVFVKDGGDEVKQAAVEQPAVPEANVPDVKTPVPSPPEQVEQPQPAPQVTAEPEPQPDRSEPAQQDLSPPTEPVPAPAPVEPAQEAPASAPPEPAPEPQKKAALDSGQSQIPSSESPQQAPLTIQPSATELRQFVAEFGSSNTCFNADVQSLSGQIASITVTSTEETSRAFHSAFRSKAGFDPAIILNPVTDSQCAFISSIGRMTSRDAAPIRITLNKPQIRGNNAETGEAGDPLSLRITGAGDRNVYVFVMDHNGDVQNINRLCASCITMKLNEVTAALSLFSPPVAEGEAPPSFYPMLAFAVASPKPLLGINAKDAFDASEFVKVLLGEMSAASGVATTAAYFRLR